MTIMRTPTTSTRLDELTDQLVNKSAERRGVTRAVWIRNAIEAAIEAEELAAEQAPTLAGMGKQLEALEKGLRENLNVTKRSLGVIADLSNRLTVEGAADRAVAQQIYRIALRAAYVGVKSLAANAPAEKREDHFQRLCDEADAIYEEDGLLRLEEEMRDAREEVRQTLDRGGVS